MYEEKHFAQSFNLDPTLLEGADIEELEAILQSFKEMDGNKHFVFLSNTNDMFIVSRFVLLFSQKGFHYLSACLEGYEKWFEKIAGKLPYWKFCKPVNNQCQPTKFWEN